MDLDDLARGVADTLVGHQVGEAQLALLRRLAAAADDTDGTHQHIDRVGRLAERLVKVLDAADELAQALPAAATLHDIGKVGIPQAVLNKPGPLTDDERRIMQRHTKIGAAMLTPSPSPTLRVAAIVARSHHERWDATGYPDRLGGDDIPLAARIVAVADVFDALTHPRIYKPAWSVADALAHVATNAGAHFDPDVADALARLDIASPT
jgi:putative two-component system response regulator